MFYTCLSVILDVIFKFFIQLFMSCNDCEADTEAFICSQSHSPVSQLKGNQCPKVNVQVTLNDYIFYFIFVNQIFCVYLLSLHVSICNQTFGHLLYSSVVTLCIHVFGYPSLIIMDRWLLSIISQEIQCCDIFSCYSFYVTNSVI